MSTCPDPDLYSALIDGEVPSPWKEKLERHLDSCAECRKKADRFLRTHEKLASGSPVLSADRLEASFASLCAKRNVAMASLAARAAPAGHPAPAARSPFIPSSWTHASVRLSLPAFAAVLAAAVFIPSVIALGALARGQSSSRDAQSLAVIQTGPTDIDSSIKALREANPVYSPDLPGYSSAVSFSPNGQRQIFSLLNYARQYTNRQDLLSGSQIIIIKLPKLTRFEGGESQLFPAAGALGTAAGLSR